MKSYKITKFLTLVIIVSLSNHVVIGQSRQELEKQRLQIIKDIEKTSKALESTRKTKEKTVSALKVLENQMNSRKQLINVIKTEVVLGDRKINENLNTLKSLNTTRQKLRDQYSKLLRINYLKKLSNSKWTYLLSSESLNNLLLRWRYLTQFKAFLFQKSSEIINTSSEIKAKNEEITNINKQKQANLQVTAKNISQLQLEQKEKDLVFKKLSTEEVKLTSKLKKREKERENLNSSIERMIVSELSRTKAKEKEDVTAVKKKEIDNTDFAKNRGALSYPVDGGKITGLFGTHPHPTYKNLDVTNNGIDFSLPRPSNIECVFDGEVSGVVNIPGYNTVVMIKHGSYMTIYAKLSSVNVSQGQKVRRGQKIGFVTTNDEGNVELHFELYKDKVRLNPQKWFSK